MGRIAGQQHPAHPIVRHDALMDAVGAHFHHIVGRVASHDALQLGLDAGGLGRLIDGLARVGIQAAAPQIGQPQQAEGAAVHPHIVHVGQARQMALERKAGGCQDGGLGVGQPLEPKVQQAAYGAFGPVGGDGIGCRHLFVPVVRLDLQEHAVVLLAQARHRRTEADLDQLLGRGRIQRQAAQLGLLALQAERVGRVVAQNVQMKLHPLVGFVHADLPRRGDQAPVDQRGGQAQRVEHLQGGRMEGRGAQVVGQGRLLFQHHRPDAEPGQPERCHQPHRPGADDGDGIGWCHGAGHGAGRSANAFNSWSMMRSRRSTKALWVLSRSATTSGSGR